MFNTFTGERINIDDVVIYLRTVRTGSSTSRKCKFVGHVEGFTAKKVNIRRLSPPDKFVTPKECRYYGLDCIYTEDVVHIIIISLGGDLK